MNEQFETLVMASDYLDKLIPGIEKVVPTIRDFRLDECGNDLADIFDGINWLTQVIALTKEIQKEEIDATEINDFMEEMAEGFEDEDYILMADLFEYEVLPILNNWNEVIKASTKC